MPYENTLNLHESSQETCWAPSNAKGPECGTESKDTLHGAWHTTLRQGRWDSGTVESWAEPLLTLSGHTYRLGSWNWGSPCQAYPANTSMLLSQLQKCFQSSASCHGLLNRGGRATKPDKDKYWKEVTWFLLLCHWGHEIPLHSRGEARHCAWFL